MRDFLGKTGSKLRREWRGGVRGAKPPGRWKIFKKHWQKHQKCEFLQIIEGKNNNFWAENDKFVNFSKFLIFLEGIPCLMSVFLSFLIILIFPLEFGFSHNFPLILRFFYDFFLPKGAFRVPMRGGGISPLLPPPWLR